MPVETQAQVILAKRYSGEEAEAAGIVQEVCPPTDIITERAVSAAAGLAGARHHLHPHLKLDRKTLATLKHRLYRDAYSALSGVVMHKSKI